MDTLDKNLDFSTFEIVRISIYGYRFHVIDNRYLTWFFPLAYLPAPSVNEPASHGFITFRIKPKAGLSVNDVITNRASIIFDYNPAVVTNTVTTSIIDERVTIVHNNEIKSIKLYPTPTADRLTLEMNISRSGQYDLQITDITGNTVYNETLTLGSGSFSKQLSLENLPKTMYLITIHSNNNEVYSGKVMKQ
jgi:hypothetical protein